jgi:hypothetical protein
MAEYPAAKEIVASSPDATTSDGIVTTRFTISRHKRGDRVEVTIRGREPSAKKSVVVVLSAADILEGEEGAKAKQDRDALIALLVQSGHLVATINCFPPHQNAVAGKYKFFTTYNRTDAANRIQDILTATAFLNQMGKDQAGKTMLNLVALDRAGVWALLARGLAPQFEKTVIDADGFNVSSDEEFLRKLPIPGIRHAGDFTTAVAIAPLTPLQIYNTGDKFQTAPLAELYRRLGRPEDFQSQAQALGNAEIVTWLSAK